MKLHLPHRKKAHARKKLTIELDPRRYWVFLLCLFVLMLAAELIYFSWVFWKTNNNIDSPATPILETNAAKIHSMDAVLKTAEESVTKRTGVPQASSSQNDSSVVQ